MGEAHCYWCDEPQAMASKIYVEKGLVHIHESCLEDMVNLFNDAKDVLKKLDGGADVPEIVEFIKRMKAQDKKWNERAAKIANTEIGQHVPYFKNRVPVTHERGKQ